MRPLREAVPHRFTPAANPFRSACVDALDFVPPEPDPPENNGWEGIARRLRQHHFRGAIVGPHGHGKTTLMLRLADHVALPPDGDGAGAPMPTCWLQVRVDPREQRRQAGELRESIEHFEGLLLIDGYDLLPWRDRLRVRRRTRPVLVTSHAETRLPTLVRCATSPALLRRLVATLSTDVSDALGDDEVSRLYVSHRGNLRDALRALYDVVAG